MTHISRRGSARRAVARLVTAGAAVALLAASVTGVAAAQSADLVFGSAAAVQGHDSTATHATTTYENLTVTHEIIGNNLGMLGDTIRYRTTISATDGPARQINEIDWHAFQKDCTGYHHWQVVRSGTVTYTNDAGERVTEPSSGDASGSWTVDPANDTTVVQDLVVELFDPNVGPAVGCGRAAAAQSFVATPANGFNLGNSLTIGADGLDDFRWSPTGVTVTCVLDCQIPGLAALGAAFGS
ncbi:hypothetical protein [Rhodococcus gannanensis]|uniref:Secreted protein n=1 Tax=Rhodococcus gannanensis TaxID=1960308 RepID=A0ABW4P6S3_9NOCA